MSYAYSLNIGSYFCLDIIRAEKGNFSLIQLNHLILGITY